MEVHRDEIQNTYQRRKFSIIVYSQLKKSPVGLYSPIRRIAWSRLLKTSSSASTLLGHSSKATANSLFPYSETSLRAPFSRSFLISCHNFIELYLATISPSINVNAANRQRVHFTQKFFHFFNNLTSVDRTCFIKKCGEESFTFIVNSIYLF